MHELEPEPPIVLCSQVGGAEQPPEREALLSQRVVRGQHALDALTPVLTAAFFPPYKSDSTQPSHFKLTNLWIVDRYIDIYIYR